MVSNNTLGPVLPIVEDLLKIDLGSTASALKFNNHLDFIQEKLGTPLKIELAGASATLIIPENTGVNDETRKRAHDALIFLVDAYKGPSKTGRSHSFDESFINSNIALALESTPFTLSFKNAKTDTKEPVAIRGFRPRDEVINKLQTSLGVIATLDERTNSYEITIDPDVWNDATLASGKKGTNPNKIMGVALKVLEAAVVDKNASYNRAIRDVDNYRDVLTAKPKATETPGNTTKKTAPTVQEEKPLAPEIQIFVQDDTEPAFRKYIDLSVSQDALKVLRERFSVTISVKKDAQTTKLTLKSKNQSDRNAQRNVTAATHALKRIINSDLALTKENMEDLVDPVASLRREFKDHHDEIINTRFSIPIPQAALTAASKTMAFELIAVPNGYNAFAVTESGIERAKAFLEAITPTMLEEERLTHRAGHAGFVKKILSEAKTYKQAVPGSEKGQIEVQIANIHQNIETQSSVITKQESVIKDKSHVRDTSKKKETRTAAEKDLVTARDKKVKAEQAQKDLKNQLTNIEAQLPEATLRDSALHKVIDSYERIGSLYSNFTPFDRPLSQEAQSFELAVPVRAKLIKGASIEDLCQSIRERKKAIDEEITSLNTQNESTQSNIDRLKIELNDDTKDDAEADTTRTEKALNDAEAKRNTLDKAINAARDKKAMVFSAIPELFRQRLTDIDEFVLFQQRLFKTHRKILTDLKDLAEQDAKTRKALAEIEKQIENKAKKSIGAKDIKSTASSLEALRKAGESIESYQVQLDTQRSSLLDIEQQSKRAQDALDIIQPHLTHERLVQTKTGNDQTEPLVSSHLHNHNTALSAFVEKWVPLQILSNELLLEQNSADIKDLEDQISKNSAQASTKQAQKALGALTADKAQKEKELRRLANENKALEGRTQTVSSETLDNAISLLREIQDEIHQTLPPNILDENTPENIYYPSSKLDPKDIQTAVETDKILESSPLNPEEKERWGIVSDQVAQKREVVQNALSKTEKEEQRKAEAAKKFAANKRNKTPLTRTIIKSQNIEKLAEFLGTLDDTDDFHGFMNHTFSSLGVGFEAVRKDDADARWAIAMYPNKKQETNDKVMPSIEAALIEISHRLNTKAEDEDFTFSDVVDNFSRITSAHTHLKGYETDPYLAFNNPDAHAFFISRDRDSLLKQIESAFGVKLVAGANEKKGRFYLHLKNSDNKLFAHEKVAQIQTLFDSLMRTNKLNQSNVKLNKTLPSNGHKTVVNINKDLVSARISKVKSGALTSASGGKFFDTSDPEQLADLTAELTSQIRKEFAAQAQDEKIKAKALLDAANTKRTDSISKSCEKIKLKLEGTFDNFTNAQAEQEKALKENDLVITDGPAATGKTRKAVEAAVMAFLNGEVEKIIIARPAVEAGASIGFLPGAVDKKYEPFMRPVYEMLDELLGEDLRRLLQKHDHLEVGSVGHLRGRTLSNAFLIVDESQNLTVEQFDMVVTRLGHGSKAAFCGDSHQCDIPQQLSGHKPNIDMIEGSKEKANDAFKNAAITRYSKEDAKTRHPLVQEYIEGREKDPFLSSQKDMVGTMKIQDFLDAVDIANTNTHPDQQRMERLATMAYNTADARQQMVAQVSMMEHFKIKASTHLRVVFEAEANKRRETGETLEASPAELSEEVFTELVQDMTGTGPLKEAADSVFKALVANADDLRKITIWQETRRIAREMENVPNVA